MSKNRDATAVTVVDRTETVATQPSNDADLVFSIGRSPRPIPDELELISLSQQGDSEAFAHLYDLHVDRIYRYILFRVSDDRLAEDLTSRVFMKMWLKLPSYKVGQSPIVAWLYRIAHNAVIDHYRTRKTTIPLEEVRSAEVARDYGIDEQLDLQIELGQLREALQELTDRQREVLILKFIEGFSIQEIARQLGKQEGAVRALQMRGLRELAKSPGLQILSRSYDQ